MKILNNQGFSAARGLLVLAIVGVIGGIGYYVYQVKNDTKLATKPTPDNSSTTNTQTSQEQTEISPQSSFNAEQFYNQIQNGMTYNQVVGVANSQTGACEYSGAPAPNDYMTCTWKDSSIEVSLSFNNQKVTYKSKRSLQ